MSVERVLVFPAHLLDQLGPIHGFDTRVDQYLPTLLDPAHLSYMPRDQAEEDPRFKQLIPYVVICCGDLIYTYERSGKGGESRLHQLWSLGVGGHICDADGIVGRAAYEVGYKRELDEEVRIRSPYTESIVGMVYDDRTPVGRVHFGIVHRLELQSPDVEPRDPALAQAQFRPRTEILSMRERLETWSAFVFDHLCATPAEPSSR